MKNYLNLFEFEKIIDIQKDLVNKNIIFLQGPMGYFFNDLSSYFFKKYKTNSTHFIFNGGDLYFNKNKKNILCKNNLKKNTTCILKYILENNISSIFLFGDERAIHKYLINKIKKINKNINIYVFEEGYIRPYYVTLEKNGVNANSNLFKKFNFNDLNLYEEMKLFKHPEHFSSRYYKMVYYASIYYLYMKIFKYKFKHYKHHRNPSPFYELKYAFINIFKKLRNKIIEHKYLNFLKNDIKNNYIFFPLQVHDDFQLRSHSKFRNTENSIKYVLKLYKKYNCQEYLVIKHHLMDRGKKDYSKLIQDEIKKLNLNKEKIIYFYDVHLPTCINNAKKCITVNSTVGLSSILSGKNTLFIGESIFNIKEFKINEEEFFKNKLKKFDNRKIKLLKYFIINKTQLNGSFYGMFPVEFEKEEMFI